MNTPTTVRFKEAPTRCYGRRYSIAANGSIKFEGTKNGGRRKQFCVTNREVAFNAALRAQAPNDDQGAATFVGADGLVLYPTSNTTIFTDDTLTISNPNGSAIEVSVLEVFYTN